jgi:hypothetical protein
MARVDVSRVGVVDSPSAAASAIASELRPSGACLSASEERFLLVSTSSLAGGQRFLAQSATVPAGFDLVVGRRPAIPGSISDGGSLSPALNARVGPGRAAKRHE